MGDTIVLCPQSCPLRGGRDTIFKKIVSLKFKGHDFRDTGDTIVSLVVSLNVSPTVSLEGHDRAEPGQVVHISTRFDTIVPTPGTQ